MGDGMNGPLNPAFSPAGGEGVRRMDESGEAVLPEVPRDGES